MGATHLPSTEFDGTAVDASSRRKPRPPWASPRRRWSSCWARTGRWEPIPFTASTPKNSTRKSCAGSYADMAAIRRFDVEATALQRQGQLALWVPLTGQEAAQIGSGRASQPQDYIFHREHGVALTRNVDLAELLRQFRGVSNGGWNPKDTNFPLHPGLRPRPSTRWATPWASSGTSQPRPRTPVGTEPAKPPGHGYFGDGASSEGDVHESMVFASSYKAPWCSSARTTTGPSPCPARCRRASRWPTAPRATASRASGGRQRRHRRARRHRVGPRPCPPGQGAGADRGLHLPRGCPHADDPTKYRVRRRGRWRAKDPLARLEKYLRPRASRMTPSSTRSRPTATNSPPTSGAPPTTSKPRTSGPLRQHVCEAHPLVAEELAWFEEYSAGFAGEDPAGQAKETEQATDDHHDNRQGHQQGLRAT